jgi:hypothetical protein
MAPGNGRRYKDLINNYQQLQERYPEDVPFQRDQSIRSRCAFLRDKFGLVRSTGRKGESEHGGESLIWAAVSINGRPAIIWEPPGGWRS